MPSSVRYSTADKIAQHLYSKGVHVVCAKCGTPLNQAGWLCSTCDPTNAAGLRSSDAVFRQRHRDGVAALLVDLVEGPLRAPKSDTSRSESQNSPALPD